MAGDLGKRVAVAAVGIPLAVFIIYLGGVAFGAFVAIIAAAAAYEVYRIAEARGIRPFVNSGVLISALLVIGATYARDASRAAPYFMYVMIASTLLLSAAAIWKRGVEGKPLTSVGVTLFAAMLTGGTLSYAVFLGALPETGAGLVPGELLDTRGWSTSRWTAPALIGFPLLLTWMSDTAAYFGGRAWGTTKLIPSISPGKTVAGAVSGVVGTTVLGAVYAWFVLNEGFGIDISIIEGAIGGALISIVAQVGDLSESLLKREAGVKDSGALLPGHGGVFDRFDSLLFAFPVAYWYLGLILSRATA